MKIIIEDVNGKTKREITLFFTERKPTSMLYDVYQNNTDDLMMDICEVLSDATPLVEGDK